MLTLPSPELRLVLGPMISGLVAILARRAGALSPSGAFAAIAIGAAALAAGWSWGALLVSYFVATSLLTRWGAATKAARIDGVVAKAGPRDWRQVAANGAVFAVAALWSAFGGGLPAAAVAAGALAAAAADSWATEIGTLADGPPRSVISWRPVPPGTSGGVSLPGTIGLVAGAAFIAVQTRLFGWPASVAVAAMAGGVAGAMVDSVLGALAQERRWCQRCGVATERTVHSCGTATTRRGGLRFVDNDVVNLACSTAGGLLALFLVQ